MVSALLGLARRRAFALAASSLRNRNQEPRKGLLGDFFGPIELPGMGLLVLCHPLKNVSELLAVGLHAGELVVDLSHHLFYVDRRLKMTHHRRCV
jgi:hypothetical protein